MRRIRSERGGLARVICTLVAVMLVSGGAWGYDQYSENADATNCRSCHGDFRASFYTELGPDGGFWFNGLHNSHQDFVDGKCDTCHSSGGRFPVLLDSSNGATDLSPISCVGCHGRDADSVSPGTPTVTEGASAGLRQHHWNADDDHAGMDLKICLDCHSDSDPAAKTPVGENVLPTYYAETTASYPNLPVDPCEASGAPLEDQYGSATTGGPDGRGTDNDGDLVYDAADSDCSATPGSPGEAGDLVTPLLVTARDSGAGTIDLSYGTACLASDNSLVWGNLNFQGVPIYNYVGQVCSIGNTGTFSNWAYSAQSFFFLVVGNDAATVEGSYGKNSSNGERGVNAVCGFSQDLPNRCD